MEAMNDEQKMLRTELCDRLMMNRKTGGVQSYKKPTRQAERLVPMTHFGEDGQKWLLIYA